MKKEYSLSTQIGWKETTFEKAEDAYYTNNTHFPAQINNDLLQSLIELIDKIKYFPGELSKDHYAVKRAEKLIDSIGG